jgi:hypothetical protein
MKVDGVKVVGEKFGKKLTFGGERERVMGF